MFCIGRDSCGSCPITRLDWTSQFPAWNERNDDGIELWNKSSFVNFSHESGGKFQQIVACGEEINLIAHDSECMDA